MHIQKEKGIDVNDRIFDFEKHIKNQENTGNKTNRDRNSKQAINQTSQHQ